MSNASVIDLSSLKHDKTPEDEYNNLTGPEQQALRDMAANNETDEAGEQVRTAFLVIVEVSGEVYATPDLDLKVARQDMPSMDDIYGAAAVIQRDITTQITSAQTVASMQQYAIQQGQRMQQAQMMKNLKL